MALPNFTPEERAKALEKAAQVRKARKELKENIKSGKTDPASVLKTRKDDPLVSKMKVKEKRFATVMPVPCQIMVRTMFVLPVRRERTLFSSRLLKAVELANRAIRMSSIK